MPARTDPPRWRAALEFGATDTLDPRTLPAGTTIQERLSAMTDGGLDYTFECIGNVHTMRQALESCHKGWGTSVIIGVAASGQGAHRTASAGAAAAVTRIGLTGVRQRSRRARSSW